MQAEALRDEKYEVKVYVYLFFHRKTILPPIICARTSLSYCLSQLIAEILLVEHLSLLDQIFYFQKESCVSSKHSV